MSEVIHKSSRSGADVTRSYVGRWDWSPAQFISAAIGLFLLIMGGVALARTLPGAENLTSPTESVFGIGHTPLMALIDIGAGLFFLGAAASRAREGLIAFGIAATAFGAVVLFEPQPFTEHLGIGTTGGAVYLGIGIVSILTGWFAGTVVVSRTRVEDTHQRVVDANGEVVVTDRELVG